MTGPDVVLRAYLDALLTGDLDVIGGFFADDAIWTLHGALPLSGTRRGRAAILEFLTSAGSLFRPGTHVLEFGEVTAQYDRAVLEWNVKGVGAATVLPYDNDYCGVFVVRDDLIVEVREYLDSHHAAEVLFGNGGEI